MPASLASFKATLEQLIRRFESDRVHYLSKDYSEAQTRTDSLTPCFKAVGWDVEIEAGLPHHARKMIMERVEARTPGRPDDGSAPAH